MLQVLALETCHLVPPIVQKDNSPIIHDMNGDFHAIYVNDYLFYVRKWRRIMAITGITL